MFLSAGEVPPQGMSSRSTVFIAFERLLQFYGRICRIWFEVVSWVFLLVQLVVFITAATCCSCVHVQYFCRYGVFCKAAGVSVYVSVCDECPNARSTLRFLCLSHHGPLIRMVIRNLENYHYFPKP
jgi:hypothetical protein